MMSLRQLNQVHGKTIIVIEHHTEFIADYCEEVCLMEQGKYCGGARSSKR